MNVIWLSSFDLSRIEQGWGQAHSNRSVYNRPLTIAGQRYRNGIGTHANSGIPLLLAGSGVELSGGVGLDDETDGRGSVVFQIVADGKEIWSSGLMRPGDAAREFTLDVKDVNSLDLLALDGGDGYDYDHADWVDLKITMVNDVKPKLDLPPIEDAVILTPKPAPAPRINGAKVFGVRPGSPFMFRIAATGDRPMTFSADGLPEGLSLDPETGQITGKLTRAGEYKVMLHAENALGRADREFRIVCGPQIGLTPAMGWNSWNCFASAVTAEDIKAAADAMVESGLVNHGWTYINIDDFWQVHRDSKDPTLQGPKRDAEGRILPNSRFPDMKELVDYVHGKGLKIGIYSVPGPWTCGGCVGSFDHELQDAQQYAEWGFDYLKYDWCSYNPAFEAYRGVKDWDPSSAPNITYAGGGDLSVCKQPFERMHAALAQQPRDILYSLCQYGMGDVWKWGAEVGGNSWRTTQDINDSWGSMSGIGFSQAGHEKYAGPGHFNDPDMLVVGHVGWGNPKPTKLTPNEQYTHISLWSLLASPLLIGCDMTELDEFTLNLLTNDEVIEVNQDPLGRQAGRITQNGKLEVWAKEMEDGSKAVGLFNRDQREQIVTVKWSDLGITGEQTVRDLWRQKDLGKYTGQFEASVGRHGVVLVRITPLVSNDAGEPETMESNFSIIEAEKADISGGASIKADHGASGGALVCLDQTGQGIRFSGLPAGSKLAIRYASVEVGTMSVAVNDQPARRVNVHSSGSLTGSFLHAVPDVTVPANATLTIRLVPDDVPVNIDRIVVGEGNLGLPPDIWNLPPLPVAGGPYSADWKALGRLYSVPEWWREAKFGAWSHWDPQSMPEQGDWYARGMYMEGHHQYNYHRTNFGHPSEYGYKDICHNWVIDRWDPNGLMDLYVEMGARYFMAMGVHHDNFDCWDSTYQPWNSVRVGPGVDIVGTWEKVARQHGLRFGIGFHNSPARTWGQFMPVRYTSDKAEPKQGEPYDALQTIRDGKGKWWEGMDPADLYGPVHTDKEPLRSPFANQFMWRVDDAITRYHPDVIYFDEHAGDSQWDLGVHMGLGFLAPQLIANYYNKSLQWNQGNMDVVINLKGVGGRYNSFQNNPELLSHVDRSLVKSTEVIIEPEIMAYPFQTETTIADWHYRTGQEYTDARKLVQSLMENVCRNGTMLLNLTQHGRGDLDPEVVRICKDIGAWLKVNGEAVYGSRPFEVYGEGSVRYTRNRGYVYAALLNWQGSSVILPALRSGGATLGKVSRVELLGSDVAMTFVQDSRGLTVTPGGSVHPLPGIADEQLASACRVLRITHDKAWFNDDDAGATHPGWLRQCNLGTGDFNNDLTTSDTPGDVWSSSFTGRSVAVIAPKELGAGRIEVIIDGQSHAIVDLSTSGMRQAQQEVCEISGLIPSRHVINVINRGRGAVALDAIIVRD